MISYSTAMAVLLALLTPVPQAAQPGSPKPSERLTDAEAREVLELVTAADRAMKGEIAAAAPWLSWQPHFLRAPDGRTYVPFTIVIEDVPEATFSSVGLYVRVAKRGDRRTSAERDRRIGPTGAPVPVFAYDAAAAASAALRLLDRPDQQQSGPYPFEAAHFTPVWWTGKTGLIRRAIAVPAGSYDLYISVRERAASVARGETPRSGVFKRELEVPDFSVKSLAMSAPILVEDIAPIPRPLEPEEQVARPYALGTAEIAPVVSPWFSAVDELSVVCFVYNAAIDGRGKPNVTAEYRLYRQGPGAAGEPLGPPLTQRLDVASLPPEFDLRAGHQLAPMQSVPLAGVAPGEYRLEIRIVDHRAGRSVSRDLGFAVR